MSKKLLLISTRTEDQYFAESCAKTAGLVLVVEPDVKRAAAHLAEGEVAGIFADAPNAETARHIEQAIADSVGLYSEKISGNIMHWIGTPELNEVSFLYQSPIFGNFICRNYQDPEVAGRRYGIVLRAAQADRAFGLANILAEGTKVQVIRFNISTQKQQGVEAVKNFLLAIKFKTRMAVVVANAVDELLMNAIFDAPVDATGKPVYAQTTRDTELELQGKHQVELHVGYDGEYIAITAVDLFGSLDKVKLFTHISKRYAEEEYKVRASYAGAGIGLATVFRSGGSFLFVSEGGVKTEVTVFFKRTDNYRDFKDQFRFISTQFYF